MSFLYYLIDDDGGGGGGGQVILPCHVAVAVEGVVMMLREAKIEVVVDDENDDHGVVGDYLTMPCDSCS